MRINIVGSGFAGLSSALFLSRHKLNKITLHEKFDRVQTVGAGILIQPSAIEILKKLDLYEPLVAHGEKINYLQGMNHRGREVFLTSYSDYAPDCFGVGIHRSSLFKALYAKCSMESNIEFRHNQEITSLADLQSRSDLLIVASGSHSSLREQVPIRQSCRVYPYGCLWTTIEDEHIAPHYLRQYLRHSQEMFGILPSGINERGKRIVSVFWSLPVRARQTYTKDEILQAMKCSLEERRGCGVRRETSTSGLRICCVRGRLHGTVPSRECGLHRRCRTWNESSVGPRGEHGVRGQSFPESSSE